LEAWKRNLAVIWVAELIAIVGFSVIGPFLPYYIQELGVTEQGQVELWSGIIIAVQAVTMAIFAPIWGSLADRYGRKLMVERAMFGGAVIMSAMALVQNVYQLAALRAIQGVFTGTVAAATTLVASSTPRDRAGYALGLLNMAVWIGASVGPLLGGIIADAYGYRAVFWVTGVLLLLAGLTVWRFVHEDFKRPAVVHSARGRGFLSGLGIVMATQGLLALFVIRVVIRTGSGLTSPTLPLFIQSLVPAEGRVASVTGLISGAAAAAAAASAVLLGRASDRLGFRPVLLFSAAATALLYIPHFFVTDPWQLLALQTLVGFAAGGTVAAYSAALAHMSPEGRQGAVYGLDTSLTSAASAVAPIVGASMAAAYGLRIPFLASAALIGVAALMTWLLVPATAGRPVKAPVAEEAAVGTEQ
jgi:DHA1 family multidrug resistance protein-like MFS transporter